MSGLAFVVAIPGLAIGSFVNVVAARVPLRRSVSKPRSSCTQCGAEIKARDNIPVVSYLLLKGRCRSCGAGISPLYPAVEAITAGLVVACALVFGATAYAALAAIPNVRAVALEEAGPTTLRFRLAFDGDPDALRRATRESPRLQLDDDAPAGGGLTLVLRP